MEDFPKENSLTFGTDLIHRSYVGLSLRDRRRHVYCVGSTGVGKSTLIKSLVVQDIHNGRGCTFIDPHGDASREVANSIPPHRLTDCIFFDTADTEHPIGLNPFDRVPEKYHSSVVSSLMICFESQWKSSWGPRMAYILRHCLNTLIVQPPQAGVTLLSIPQLLTDRCFRKNRIKYVNDPITKAFWKNEFEKIPERELAMVISPILNKLGAYAQRRELRNIIGQPRSSIQFERLMNKGKILLVNLSAATIGEDGASLLGALIVSSLQQASYRRDGVPIENRLDHFLYIDEFQSIRSPDVICSILSTARKYRLSMFLAHQYCDQIDQEVSDAVLGNCGTLCAFSIGRKDADTLAPAFHPMTPSMLSASGRGEFLFASRRNGEIQEPVLLETHDEDYFTDSLPSLRSWTNRTAGRNLGRSVIENMIRFHFGRERIHIRPPASAGSRKGRRRRLSRQRPQNGSRRREDLYPPFQFLS